MKNSDSKSLLEYRRSWYAANRVRLLAKQKKWRQDHSEHVREQGKKYRSVRTLKIKETSRRYRMANLDAVRSRTRKWREENRDHVRNYERNRRRNNVGALMKHRLSSRLRKILKANGLKKSVATLELIGTTKEGLISHIKSLFQPGMSFQNYGEWHIDHKRPCVLFDLSDLQGQKDCFHYTNLQPLWAAENLKKHDKLTP